MSRPMRWLALPILGAAAFFLLWDRRREAVRSPVTPSTSEVESPAGVIDDRLPSSGDGRREAVEASPGPDRAAAPTARDLREEMPPGEVFTLGGHVVLQSGILQDARAAEERRILVAGREGGLWRPISGVSPIGAGDWGPVSIPLGRFDRYRARIEGTGFLPSEEEFLAPRAGSHRRLDFVVDPAAELEISIQDEAGKPVPTARATAWWGAPEWLAGPGHAAGTVGSDGRIRLACRTGAVTFRVSAPGYAPVEGDTYAPLAFPVVMKRGGRIAGRCLHRGEPVADFQVIFWRASSVVAHRRETFLGREDGSFELDSLPPGDWWVLATSPRNPGCTPVLVPVPVDETARVELDLPLAIAGAGRVIDADTGLPVEGARVQVFAAGSNGRSFPWGTPTPVASDGTFELDGFVRGTNYLTAEADGYASTDVTAVAGEDFLDWGDIRLPRPQALRITLLGAESLTGLEVGDLRVHAVGLEEKRFDASNQVHYDGVRPGDHELFITYPDTSWARLHLNLDPGADWTFDFRIAGTRALDVRVLDEQEKPISPMSAVVVGAQEENGVYVARLRQPWFEGRARFEGLRASRAQVFVVSEDNQILASRDVDLGPEEQELEIRLGEGSFRIHVVDRDGAPVGGAWLSLRTEAADAFVGLADTTFDGWASFQGLPAGSLLLNVGHPVLGTRYGIPVEASSGEIEVTLEATGSLELTLRDGDVPLAGVATRIETASGVTLTDPRDTDSAGVVRYELLGAGHYRLACRRTDCWPTFVEEELGVGEKAALVVAMRRLGDLELTFTSREGLPVADLPVELHSLELDAPVATWLAEERVRSATGLTTDSTGRILVEGLPHGRYEWSATLAEPAAGTILVTPAELTRSRSMLP